jgi:hypothetical protein
VKEAKPRSPKQGEKGSFYLVRGSITTHHPNVKPPLFLHEDAYARIAGVTSIPHGSETNSLPALTVSQAYVTKRSSLPNSRPQSSKGDASLVLASIDISIPAALATTRITLSGT